MPYVTRFLRLLLRGVLAVTVALGLAELGLRVVDGFAFPHLNVYEPDASLGVHLRPGATERVAFGGNPASDVRINAQGFRGADWPAPAAGEIVIVGDSQVFGLGVEERDTLSTNLANATGRPVINAGVPTYGPAEYRAVVDRLLAERHPSSVVMVVNFSNDLFEKERPNRERHKVWDGWAVRAETMPEGVTEFPGRSWLFRESHLAFAFRRALYTPSDPADAGVASEGTAGDLVAAVAATGSGEPPPSAAAGEPGAAGPDGVDAAGRTTLREQEDAARERRYAEDTLLWLLTEVDPTWKYADRVAAQAVREHNQPGDIVYEAEAEGARGVPVTAELLARGAKMRKVARPTLEAWLAAHPNPSGRDASTAEQVRKTLADWESYGKRLGELATAPTTRADAAPSALHDWLVDLAVAVEAGGAELTVVALPLDVQVSDAEWAKYKAAPVDMTESRALLDDLVADAHARGLRAISVLPALAAAEPGAFLDGDLHMSAKGTAAVGQAIAATLAAPAPVVKPGPGFPVGRSRMPEWDEAALADEVTVAGSTRNRCSTRRVREWLAVDCSRRNDSASDTGEPPDLQLVAAPLESAWTRRHATTSVLLPLIPGYDVTVDFRWKKAVPGPMEAYGDMLRTLPSNPMLGALSPSANADLQAALEAGVSGTLADGLSQAPTRPAAVPPPPTPSAAPPVPSPAVTQVDTRTAALLADDPWQEGRHESLTVRWSGDTPTIRFEPSTLPFVAAERSGASGACLDDRTWLDAWFNETRGCAATYAACDDLVRCAQGAQPPTCAAGTAPVGGPGWCYALCDATNPCAEGRCTAWEGGHVCM